MVDFVNSQYGALDYGIASTDSDTFAYSGDLVTGNQPPIGYADFPVKAGTALLKWSPVSLDATTGGLVPATQGTPAIGIVMSDVTPTADIKLNIMISGCFNPDRLQWPASYTTDDQKLGAFMGAPTPTTIRLLKRETYAATSNIKA